jgi:hypothetical protein
MGLAQEQDTRGFIPIRFIAYPDIAPDNRFNPAVACRLVKLYQAEQI